MDDGHRKRVEETGIEPMTAGLHPGRFTARTILPDDEQVGDLAEVQRVVRARGLFTVT